MGLWFPFGRCFHSVMQQPKHTVAPLSVVGLYTRRSHTTLYVSHECSRLVARHTRVDPTPVAALYLDHVDGLPTNFLCLCMSLCVIVVVYTSE
ncbi:hypothetical protein M0804_014738 [Polistes exclamans]|nr:hypothetical protein M0804_014740 [Polistes exclamans]KAI4474656.1 hypothetical protein M0804_014738 [Polistes exclamans]